MTMICASKMWHAWLGVPAAWGLFPIEPHRMFSLCRVVLKPAKSTLISTW